MYLDKNKELLIDHKLIFLLYTKGREYLHVYLDHCQLHIV